MLACRKTVCLPLKSLILSLRKKKWFQINLFGLGVFWCERSISVMVFQKIEQTKISEKNTCAIRMQNFLKLNIFRYFRILWTISAKHSQLRKPKVYQYNLYYNFVFFFFSSSTLINRNIKYAYFKHMSYIFLHDSSVIHLDTDIDINSSMRLLLLLLHF